MLIALEYRASSSVFIVKLPGSPYGAPVAPTSSACHPGIVMRMTLWWLRMENIVCSSVNAKVKNAAKVGSWLSAIALKADVIRSSPADELHWPHD